MRLTFLLVVLVVAGCGDSGPPMEVSRDEDEIFNLFASIPITAIEDAYDRLNGFAYTTERTLEEQDNDGQVAASESRTIRRTPTADGVEESTLESSSTGSFTSADLPEESLHPQNPLSRITSDEPAYTSLRTRDRYAYEMLPDTTIGDQRVRVAQATLHQNSASEQPIRYARYYLSTDGGVIGVDVRRLSESALFSENSHVTVFLQRHPTGEWLPDRAISETTIQTPANEPARLRLTQIIRDITAVE